MWAIGKWYSKYESDHNTLAQHGRGNNVILSGIPESVSEDLLEESVISILADIDVLLESQDIEACHRFGKPNRDRSLKTIVLFVNRKNCKKVLFNKNKLREQQTQFYSKYENLCEWESDTHEWVNCLQLQKVEAQWSHSWLLLERWHYQNQTLGER